MSNKTTSKYERGAEWRKWDLHVHTPGTLKEDCFEGENLDERWTKFCETINQHKEDIVVIGITDYLLLDNYKKFVQLAEDGTITKKFDLILPNIELRLTPVTADGKALNVHLIIDPEFVTQLDERIHSKLSMKNGSTTYTATKDSLVRLGKSINSRLSDEDAYKEGARKFVVDFDSFKTVFDNDQELREHCIIVVSNSSNDGASGVTQHSSFLEGDVSDLDVKRQSIYKLSDAIFSANPKDREYFLGNGVDDKETVVEKCDSLKPCIHGCDAHTNDKIFNPDESRFCWIKADSTFEGLKQIIYEPGLRVFIGNEPDVETRVKNNQTKYIESLHIDQNEEYDESCGVWFKKVEILLNKELIAIIGNKGSGKSALTDIIGLLGNSHNQKYDQGNTEEELFSFLNKRKFLKKRCASNFNGKLDWYSGDPETAVLDAETDRSIPEKVEYIPQKYLEKICANIEDDEFRKKLNEVIFGYVQSKDRHGKQRLEDLIAYLTNQAEQDINALKERLHEKNKEVVLWEQKLTSDYASEIEDKILSKKEELDAHEKNKPDEVPKPKEENQKDDGRTGESNRINAIDKEISRHASDVEQLKSELTKLTSCIEELNQAKTALERVEQRFKDLNKKYNSLFISNGLNFEDVVKISTNFEKVTEAVEKKRSRIKEINQTLREPEDIESDSELDEREKEDAKGKSLLHVLKKLEEEKKGLVDTLDKPEKDYQNYLKRKAVWNKTEKELRGEEENPLEGTLNWLIVESKSIKDTYPTKVDYARSERENIAKEIFGKKKEYISFYNSVKVSIDKEIDKYKEELGEYKIKIEAGMKFDESFYDNFFQFISQGVMGSFYGSEGSKVIQKIIENVNDWESENEVFSALEQIIKHLDEDKRENTPEDKKTKSIFTQLKRSKEPIDLYDYLFGLDYIETKYDLKVDDKDLSELSPGERGGLLLIFYLMLDQRDIPLVIDQPEDNLDNESVYKILVTFLKRAKERRQIILVTHNPNLAVVADAEQIIYVSIDKKNKTNKFNYLSGAIENPEINKKVVDILEGTYPAFDNRRLKYRKNANKNHATSES
ncbi:MAG: hypothetical protein WD595_02965 [Waddliaceae bacterium]